MKNNSRIFYDTKNINFDKQGLGLSQENYLF